MCLSLSACCCWDIWLGWRIEVYDVSLSCVIIAPLLHGWHWCIRIRCIRVTGKCTLQVMWWWHAGRFSSVGLSDVVQLKLKQTKSEGAIEPDRKREGREKNNKKRPRKPRVQLGGAAKGSLHYSTLVQILEYKKNLRWLFSLKCSLSLSLSLVHNNLSNMRAWKSKQRLQITQTEWTVRLMIGPIVGISLRLVCLFIHFLAEFQLSLSKHVRWLMSRQDLRVYLHWLQYLWLPNTFFWLLLLIFLSVAWRLFFDCLPNCMCCWVFAATPMGMIVPCGCSTAAELDNANGILAALTATRGHFGCCTCGPVGAGRLIGISPASIQRTC